MENECPKCKGAKRVKDKDGTIHFCYDCLLAGRLDTHDKTLKDGHELGIKL